MSEGIFKIWGERKRILLTPQTEIDLLHVKKNTFCSTHSHVNKINRFVVISGKIKIETDYGTKILYPNESWTVYPPRLHRFFALEDSTMVECAFTDRKKEIDPNDISRKSQGGRIVKGKEITLDEMKEKGLLDLCE